MKIRDLENQGFSKLETRSQDFQFSPQDLETVVSKPENKDFQEAKQ